LGCEKTSPDAVSFLTINRSGKLVIKLDNEVSKMRHKGDIKVLPIVIGMKLMLGTTTNRDAMIDVVV